MNAPQFASLRPPQCGPNSESPDISFEPACAFVLLCADCSRLGEPRYHAGRGTFQETTDTVSSTTVPIEARAGGFKVEHEQSSTNSTHSIGFKCMRVSIHRFNGMVVN